MRLERTQICFLAVRVNEKILQLMDGRKTNRGSEDVSNIKDKSRSLRYARDDVHYVWVTQPGRQTVKREGEAGA